MSESSQKSTEKGELLVVNLRGIVNTKYGVRTALDQMGILKRFSATVVPNSPEVKGVLNLAKNNVAWCELDSQTLGLLQKKSEAKSPQGSNGEKTQNERRVYRLNSPRGGFKRSIRRQYGQGGILGPNPKLPELVSAMTSGK
jgi:large subunit ribosomal protein L30